MFEVREVLKRKDVPLTVSVETDEFIKVSEKAFDCIFNGTSEFYPWALPESLPDEFSIGVIDWLEPEWVINTDMGHLYDGFFLSDQKSISKYIRQTAVSGECLKTITI